MRLCIFNPEHDLCLAKGRAHYVPPRSAVEFARRDADIMAVLYPGAVCASVYDLTHSSVSRQAAASSPNLGERPDCVSSSSPKLGEVDAQRADGGVCQVIAWGWDAVVKHELLKRGIPAELLPSDEEIATIRELQHRSTVLPLQEDCHEVRSIENIESLLKRSEHWVMKAPWSGAGRGLRWVHGQLTAIDRDWLLKTVAAQRCVIAEPRREVVADVALEYFTHSSVSRQAADSSPNLGEQPDCVSRSSPKFGEQLDCVSRSSPKFGEQLDCVSRSSPNLGEQPDCVSRSSPKLGEVAVRRTDGGVCPDVEFLGYSYFKTGSGVYKENVLWTDAQIEAAFPVREARERIEPWLAANVWPRYRGPLGVDLMVDARGQTFVSEINFRHTMGMVAHEKINQQ